MGLFGSNENCSICGQTVKGKRLRVSDGVICSSCIELCSKEIDTLSFISQAGSCTVSDFRSHIEFMKNENKSREQIFKESSCVDDHIKVDFENKLFYFPEFGLRSPLFYLFSDLVNYELVEDGSTLLTGGFGSAAVGGILLGPAGMITGSILGKKHKDVTKSLYITITLNNPLLSFKKIDFIKSEVKKGSITYKLKKKAAENLISVLDRICRSAEPTVSYVQPQINISAADEIKKFKELLDAGIITEEEFNAKKKQLLNL